MSKQQKLAIIDQTKTRSPEYLAAYWSRLGVYLPHEIDAFTAFARQCHKVWLAEKNKKIRSYQDRPQALLNLIGAES